MANIYALHTRQESYAIGSSKYYSSKKKAERAIENQIQVNRGTDRFELTDRLGKNNIGQLYGKDVIKYLGYRTTDRGGSGRTMHMECIIEKIELSEMQFFYPIFW